MDVDRARVVLMFRCARLAAVVFLSTLALPLAPFDAWCASWGEVGEEYYVHLARTKGFYVVGGVRVKLSLDDGDAMDAPGREIGGTAADVGGSGE